MQRFYLISAALLLDFMFGDPYWLYHPVQAIGLMITFMKGKITKVCTREYGVQRKKEILGGAVLAFVIIIGTYLITDAALYVVGKIHKTAGLLLELFWSYQILAAKCLKTETDKVKKELEADDLHKARISISYLVGRDTKKLSKEEIAKACVETIAENTTDGVIAPLFYLFLGGVPLAMAYKAINTLDSMVGYRNEEYEYLGKVSAKIDDIANYVPSRLAALAMIGASYVFQMDGKRAWHTYLADRKAHLSPNCGQTESVAAGALRICLGGTHDYFGKPVVKPTIGEELETCDGEKIKEAQRLMYGSLMICFLIFSLVYTGILCIR